MSETYHPDLRYADMTRTEIENLVKAKSSLLLSQQHIIPESSGKKIKFRVTEQDIEHLVSDALHRAKDVLLISDISSLPQLFKKAIYIKTDKDTKKGKKGVWYHYYKLVIDGRELYLNIYFVKQDQEDHETSFHHLQNTNDRCNKVAVVCGLKESVLWIGYFRWSASTFTLQKYSFFVSHSLFD